MSPELLDELQIWVVPLTLTSIWVGLFAYKGSMVCDQRIFWPMWMGHPVCPPPPEVPDGSTLPVRLVQVEPYKSDFKFFLFLWILKLWPLARQIPTKNPSHKLLFFFSDPFNQLTKILFYTNKFSIFNSLGSSSHLKTEAQIKIGPKKGEGCKLRNGSRYLKREGLGRETQEVEGVSSQRDVEDPGLGSLSGEGWPEDRGGRWRGGPLERSHL